ncbi:MAG: hypothetical protein Q7T33_12220 [Dehalococcoidia bacterium]|nr:hypothetical protein [Dehalococcoidia bacterium]
MKQRTKYNLRRVSYADILEDLKDFEEKFGMSSKEFYEKFSRGEMGDDQDVIEWAGLYEWSLRETPKSSKP